MHTIPGYSIVQELYVGSRSSVFKAHTINNPSDSVVIKVLKHHDDPARVAKFEQEFVVAKGLRGSPHIISVRELVHNGGVYAIVYEDTFATPLDVIIHRKGVLDQGFFLKISIQICEALHGVHSQWFIHKDVNPSNIVVDLHTGTATLIDFGMSEECSPTSLVENVVSVGKIEGTLAYISPEQTGRTDSVVDFRSDLYSYGASMFHMLAGRPPFDISKDTLSLVHAHLAKPPPDINQFRKDLHPMIPFILSKLLHKNPSMRYQSAKGLKHDLMRCWEEVGTGAETNFALGEKDISATLEISDNISCHKEEKEALLSALERVSSHSPCA